MRTFILLMLAVCLAPTGWAAGGCAGGTCGPRVTKGAPAKGPSDKTFSKTLERRKSSLGQPVGETTVMKSDAEAKVKAIEAANSRSRQDAATVSRLMTLVASDTNCLKRVDDHGRTLLHQAAFAGYGKSAAYLLKRGADRQARDSGGATPVELARRGGYPEVAAAIERFEP